MIHRPRLSSVRARLRRRAVSRRREPALPLAGPALLEAFAAAHPRAVFVEIGANDGKQHDFLRPHILAREWRGVMVEPVPYVFERLRRNYGDIDRVALENLAIADRDGTAPFYHLAEADGHEREQLPSWYDGIGSFSREAVLGHSAKIADLPRRLVQREVPTLTFATLCERHDLDRVDLLLIDAEGYDHELLRQIDLDAAGVRLLIYEHFHLSPADRAACRHQVQAAGYETMEEGFDTFCLRATVGDSLSSGWRDLRPGVPALYVEDEPR